MFDKMKQLMEMKKQADRIKRELDAEVIDVENSGINIKINGSQNFQSIELDEGALSAENKLKLEADLLSAVNQAINQSQQVAAEKMKSQLPGLGGM